VRILFELDGVGAKTPLTFARVCTELLNLVVDVNRGLIRTGAVPPLYTSGVQYVEEPPDVDSFVDASTVLKRGAGDCAHLAAWRVAELLELGEPAKVRIKWAPENPRGPRAFHAEVRRADGTTEDPSKTLGMRRRYGN